VLARTCAGAVAVAVMFGVVGWVGTPLLVRGSLEPLGLVYVGVVALACGAGAYFLMTSFVERSLAPLGRLTAALREAAARPRDQITVVRRFSVDEAVLPEVRAQVEALHTLLSKIEQRHARQSAWIGAVVHDVKTPLLAAANTLGAIAASPNLANTEEGALTARLAHEMRTLTRDVQRMLDAIRFEREDVDAEQQPVDLFEIASGIQRRTTSREGITVLVHGSGSTIGDRALLERSIENLIVNAVRYARSRVDVHVFSSMVRIVDDGPGLPAPLDHLALPFRSEPIEVAGVTVAGGAGGIGLFLARRVLELHGGKLVVESTSTHGTTLIAYTGSHRGA
jgi:signal transduction histidine kinase